MAMITAVIVIAMSAILKIGKLKGIWIKSTTWPLGKPGYLVKRSIKFPTTPPKAKPPRINQDFVVNRGTKYRSASVASDEVNVKNQVEDPPREKAARSLKTKVRRKTLPSTSTGSNGFKNCSAKSLVS